MILVCKVNTDMHFMITWNVNLKMNIGCFGGKPEASQLDLKH